MHACTVYTCVHATDLPNNVYVCICICMYVCQYMVLCTQAKNVHTVPLYLMYSVYIYTYVCVEVHIALLDHCVCVISLRCGGRAVCGEL